MSSLDDEDLPSLSFQKAEINAFINPTLIQVFLMGMYYSYPVTRYRRKETHEDNDTRHLYGGLCDNHLSVWCVYHYRGQLIANFLTFCSTQTGLVPMDHCGRYHCDVYILSRYLYLAMVPDECRYFGERRHNVGHLLYHILFPGLA